jgi:hypothetical protein
MIMISHEINLPGASNTNMHAHVGCGLVSSKPPRTTHHGPRAQRGFDGGFKRITLGIYKNGP